jgi:hypothetical protein
MTCCGVVAGCGGSGGSSSSSTFTRAPANSAQVVCASAQKAAVAALGRAVTLRITDRDPTNVECVLRASGTRLDLVAQQSPRAWAEWDTTQTHLVQAYGASDVHQAAQIPRIVNAPGVLVGWVPAQRLLFATNGTQSLGGSYVTIKVSGRHRHGTAEVKLARAISLAALKVAPKGPNLPPPS